MAITLKICDDQKEWDSLVEKSPHGTIFHTWKFLKIMENHSKIRVFGNNYRSKLYPMIGLRGSNPIGIYPLFYYDSFFIRYVFSPPLGTGVTYQGPLIVYYDNLKQSKKESYLIDLQKSLDKFITLKLRSNFIKVRTSPGLIDARPFLWSNYTVELLYNYEINLQNRLDEILNSFPKSRRKNIKRTEKSGLSVSEGSKKEIEFVFESLKNRYQAQSINPELDKYYLFNVYKAFYSDNLRVFVVKKDERYLAGVVLLMYNKRVHVWLGCTKTSISGLYPNDLLLWECIKWAHNEGYEIFELTWANTYRLCRYKSRYNPLLSLYFSCEKYSPFISFLHSIKKKIKPDESKHLKL